MKTMQATLALIGFGFGLLSCQRPPSADLGIEQLITELAKTSEIGYGYSAMFSGSQFLPAPDSDQVGTLVLGSQAPSRSTTLEAIVKRGVRAIPALLAHLDDTRETKVPPLKAMMWMSFADEYDFNRRVRTEAPKGVNRETFGQNQPSSHTITVGDLCFVAIGQIVNRNFNATRYQPTGGLIVSSPTYSKVLCDLVRSDFQGLNEQTHRQMLIQDFTTPDHEERRIGAYRRLAFYYPDEVEALVLKQLAVPVFDVIKIDNLIRDDLYPEKSTDKRKSMYEQFVKLHGPASADGIRLYLFSDLRSQEAAEQKRMSSNLPQHYDARACLVQLYGYPEDVKSTDKPYVDTWEGAERARFIKALVHDPSTKIDQAVHEIFLNAK